MITTLVETLINALAIAGLYALVSTGLALILGVRGVVNFAQADWMTMSSFLIISMVGIAGAALWWAVAPLAVLATSAFGCLVYLLVVKPSAAHPHINQLLATFALSIAIQSGLQLLYDAHPRSLQLDVEATQILGLRIPTVRLIDTAVAFAVLAGLHLLLRDTRVGRGIRATSQNRDGAILTGIDVYRMDLTVFALAGASSGVAGVLWLTTYSVTPTLGSAIILHAFAVVALAGLGGRIGAVIPAALLLGLAESFTGEFIGSEFVPIVSFGAILGVLLFWPQGIAASKGRKA